MAHFQELRQGEAAEDTVAPWTTEEDDALDALMEGCTSWADLTELLQSDEGLAARTEASWIPLLAGTTNPPHPSALYTTAAVSKSCTPEPVSSH